MQDRTKLALEATRRLRQSPAFRALGGVEREALVRDLGHIERTLSGERYGDPYALSMATPADLQRELAGPGVPTGGADPSTRAAAPAPVAAAPPSPQRNVDKAGRVAADAVEAVNFPGFVAGLIHGTFQAIVDATGQQVREYADLVASLSRSVDDFSRDNVSGDQTRAWLASRHPADLRHEVPPPGKAGEARLLPARSDGQPPAWLDQYGLGGQELTPELANGPLLDAGQRRLGEERLQTLASMVLMGINRIVVNDGDIRAKVQIFAVASDKTDAELVTGSMNQGSGIASRSGLSGGPSMMVQTVRANAQSEANVKTNLTGEVKISFKTETFPLERFADSAAIQLLNRHARWRTEDAPSAVGATGAGAVGTAPAGKVS